MDAAVQPESGPGEDEPRLNALLAAAERDRQTGRHTSGIESSQEALSLAERLRSPERRAQALYLLATHQFRLGENEASLSTNRLALAAFEELGDLNGMSHALNGMVMADHELGLQEEALERAAQSLEIAKQSGDPLTLAWAYNRAGLAHAAVGDILEGVNSMEFALGLARDVGDPEALFAAINNLVEDLNALVRSQLETGQSGEPALGRALQLGPEGLALARASGNNHRVATILLNLGRSQGLAGREQEALDALAESEEISERNGFRSLVLATRQARAEVAVARGQVRAAIERYQALVDDAERASDRLILLDAYRSLWRAHKQLGEYREALEHHERYYELERQQQTDAAQTRARVLASQLELDRARQEARRATLEAALERSRTRELEAQTVALREEQVRLTRRADQDVLTGLWNRRHVERELPKLVHEAGERQEPLSVAFVDADHFKSINDRFGHLAGDEVLRRIARLLRAKVRPSDVVARVGGEEFVILLPRASPDAAVALGQRLCAAVRQARWEDVLPGGGVTVSVGVATAAEEDEGAAGAGARRIVAQLLARADGALYAAKRAGRDRVEVAS
jgi:diguanylate cyclase (GGDEF)-like protein